MISIHDVRNRIVHIATAVCLALTAFVTAGCHPHIRAKLSPLAPHQAPPDPPPSVLTVNVNASLMQLGGSLDDAIPASFNTGSVCTALGLACVQGFLGREPLRLNLTGSHLSLRSMLHYQLDGNFIGISGTCGKPDNTRRRATIAYDANLSLSPDWKVTVADGHAAVAPVDRCKVTGANFNVTDKAMAALNRALEGFTQKAARKLSESTTLRDRANEAWHQTCS